MITISIKEYYVNNKRYGSKVWRKQNSNSIDHTEKCELTVRHSCSDWFINFTGLTEPSLILGKHSKHIVTAFKQPGFLVLQRRGVNIAQEHVLSTFHVSLLNDVTSQCWAAVVVWTLPWQRYVRRVHLNTVQVSRRWRRVWKRFNNPFYALETSTIIICSELFAGKPSWY